MKHHVAKSPKRKEELPNTSTVSSCDAMLHDLLSMPSVTEAYIEAALKHGDGPEKIKANLKGLGIKHKFPK
jgi:hypothetical protein